MNTRIKLAAALAALGLVYAWTAKGAYDGTSAECNDPPPTLLSFALEVHEGVTKNSFRIAEGGWLRITNKSPDKPLRIQTKDRPPFTIPGLEEPQSGFTVPPGRTVNVKINAAYTDGSRFTYSSQIEGSAPDDPIVIIERP